MFFCTHRDCFFLYKTGRAMALKPRELAVRVSFYMEIRFDNVVQILINTIFKLPCIDQELIPLEKHPC